jgi:hypothetical protein
MLVNVLDFVRSRKFTHFKVILLFEQLMFTYANARKISQKFVLYI